MTAAARPASRRPVPRLDLSGPRTLGLAATAAVAALVAGAAMTPINSGPTTTAMGRVRAEPIQIRHADGGLVARLLVKEGDTLESGQLIATLDTRLLDGQITGLKRQMDGIQLHVSGLKQEADAVAASDRQSAQRQRLAGLEAQIAASEQESLGLHVRLTMTEQEKARTEIRAPLAGRLLKVMAPETASVAPNGVIAVVQPAADRLVLEASWPATAVASLHPERTIAVWPRDAMPWSSAFAGRIERRAEAGAQTRVSVVVDLSATGLDSADARDGERAFTLQIAGAQPSLLATFLAPVTGALIRPASKAAP